MFKVCFVISKLFHWSFKNKNITFQILNESESYFASKLIIPSQNYCQNVLTKAKENVDTYNKFSNRTHTCGELTVENLGENVELCGWVEFQRLDKFIILRDAYGSTQLIFNHKNPDLLKLCENLSLETVIRAIGKVVPRPKDQNNPKMKTGYIEVLIESIEILNPAKSILPFNIRNYNKAKDLVQMKYRYLALRFPEIQRNLRIRSWVTMKIREYLVNECGFVEVETPTLFRRTPGGAQEFIVPTRNPGKFYSLVQSPQQFKQLLMVGGIDRYFQIARCYRDEQSRNDRQPEFTQVDIEMSFADKEHVIEVIEKMLFNSWPHSSGDIKTPFQRISYEDAMEMFGSESPDLRIPYTIQNVSELIANNEKSIDNSIYALVFPDKQDFLTTSTKQNLIGLCKQKFPNIKLLQLKISDDNKWQKDLNKFFSTEEKEMLIKNLNFKNNDVLFISIGQKNLSRQLLGDVRVEFTNILESKSQKIRSDEYKFVWVIDFPLFDFNKDTNSLESMHHPFTQPHLEDITQLSTNPTKVRGLHYDLVLNGNEIGGGSIRIHKSKLQEEIFNLLKINSFEMSYLLEALDSGAPPHGGFALGLDRYISIICKSQNIKDVIAFPKTMEGRDLMSGAPVNISEEDKKLYHIDVTTN